DAGIEIYDKAGELVAWEGPSGPDLQREVALAIDGRLAANVTHSPISSQLFVCTPVRENGLIAGAVLVRRTIELNYPLSTRFMQREGLTAQLSRDIGVGIQFEFGEEVEPTGVEGRNSAPLHGIDSALVGMVSVDTPLRKAHLDDVRRSYSEVRSGLLALAIGIVVLLAAGRANSIPAPLYRFATLTIVLWVCRYALLMLGMPSSHVDTGVFDPAVYASTFGGGLSKSIGEMSLTTVAVALNTLLLVPAISAYRSRFGFRRGGTSHAFSVVLAAGMTFFLFWGMRGYAAIIRSAVFDSVLLFRDPRALFPTFELGVLGVNLVVLSICMAAISVLWTVLAHGLLSRYFDRGTGWLILTLLYVTGSVLFGLSQPNPLLTVPYRLVFTVVTLLFASYLSGQLAGTRSLMAPVPVVIVVLFSALLLYPVLQANALERGRQRVETFAAEVLRPVDNWLSFVVSEALDLFTSPETVLVLRGGDEDELRRLAFTRWAKSVASKEGYAAVFVITDTLREEVSRFTIGGRVDLTAELDADLRLAGARTILIRDAGGGATVLKAYGGSTPIAGVDGTLLGYGRVIITAGEQSLFRGENRSILRPGIPADGAAPEPRVGISEHDRGSLLVSRPGPFPIGHELTPGVRAALHDPDLNALWHEEEINGKTYATYYVKKDLAGDQVVGLSLLGIGPVQEIVDLVKLMVHYSLAAIVFCLLYLGVRAVRRKPLVLTFRAKLLTALIVTAIIPLVLFAFYGRYHARERLREITEYRLEDQTTAVATNIMMGIGRDEDDVVVQVSPPVAEAVADEVGTDFSLYIGRQLVVTSRPDLYEAGILNRRMNGNAYASVLLMGRRFHVQTERIGRFEYAVGYRPVVDGDGIVVGVVSVPTLQRSDGVEEEMNTRNALLLGAFALVVLSVILIAIVFANRIAAPIQRLTGAMRQIARGNLDVSVSDGQGGAADEIGELMQSFDAMARDLKRNREELIRYEREVAWNEMARQVVHEIKNPLTPMKLSVQHLRQTYRDGIDGFGEVLEAVTQSVMEQIDALSRIASEFATFARMPRRKVALCHINDVLQEVVQLFAQHEEVRFDVRFSYDVPQVLADRGELRRAFINIVRNAIQAMGGKGHIIVTTELRESRLLVTVQDDGPGIPEEVRTRLFQPNFSTKTEGMGLGLAIVKKTIDDLRGTIAIESEPGKGTTVLVTLPVTESSLE
ncbi:MAG: ATP-binding protein, partial [Bacteroidota bacterium]